MTTVVNCKVANIRPAYENLKLWMEDPQNVYIGRAGVVFIDGKRFPEKASPFCNPFKIGRDGTRDQVLEKYKEHILGILKTEPNALEQLRGKRLGCWCKPEGCHGDILVELLANNKN